MPQLLLIEDDSVLAPLIVSHLTESGYHVEWVQDGAAAQSRLLLGKTDLIILDVMLPGEDGFSLCRRIRKSADVAIIMVTARGEESDRVMGLQLGADDYLPKPFSLWELEARVQAVLRRYVRRLHPGRELRIGGLKIDLDQRSVSVDGEAKELTRSEFDMLVQLANEPGRVLSREQLLVSVQGGEAEAYDRVVDAHISNLRRKLEKNPKSPVYLKTVWGIGYKLDLSA